MFPKDARWASPEDALSLHDDTSSIKLAPGSVDAGGFTTGMCVAVRGFKESKTSPFSVRDFVFAGAPPLPAAGARSGGMSPARAAQSPRAHARRRGAPPPLSPAEAEAGGAAGAVPQPSSPEFSPCSMGEDMPAYVLARPAAAVPTAWMS